MSNTITFDLLHLIECLQFKSTNIISVIHPLTILNVIALTVPVYVWDTLGFFLFFIIIIVFLVNFPVY